MRQAYDTIIILSLAAITATTLLVYWPGLYGTFLLDDLPNLAPLGRWPDQDTLTRALYFITSGQSGPTGRPLVLLSFLIHDTNWPSDPFAFKYTNLLLHLLNGMLVFWFVSLLLTQANSKTTRAYAIATTVTFFWLIHPLQVSTVLYVIQRATELSTLFTLAAIITWLYGRRRIADGDYVYSLLITVAIGTFSLLSVLCKENGALVPLYILTLEIVLRPQYYSRKLSTWLRYFAFMPSLILVIFLVYKSLSTDSWDWRTFTLGERLLSEAHALAQYIMQIIFPRMSGLGLFHDDFPISKSLTNPTETIFSVLLILTLLSIAWYFKRKLPLLSFSIAWYFVGHIIESTVLPLEIYFEHRNYLPMLGILLALTSGAIHLLPTIRWAGLALLAGYSLAFTSITAANTELWGKPLEAAITWAKENPGSIRAQLTARSAIQTYANKNRYEGEYYHLQELLSYHPDSATALITWLDFQCTNMQVVESQISNIIRVLETAKLHPADITPIQDLAQKVITGDCDGKLTNDDSLTLATAAINNPHAQHPAFLGSLHYIMGQIYAAKRNLNDAMHHFDKSYNQKPDIDIRLQQVFYLYTAGLYNEALTMLDDTENNSNVLILKLRLSDITKLREHIHQAQHKDS